MEVGVSSVERVVREASLWYAGQELKEVKKPVPGNLGDSVSNTGERDTQALGAAFV